MPFWMLAVLMVVVALAILLPSLFGRRRRTAVDRASLNTRIFNERMAELDRARAAGELSEEDQANARHELERELLRDAGDGSAGDEAVQGRAYSLPSAALVALFVPVFTVGVYLGLGDLGLATGERSAAPPRQAAGAAGPDAGAQQPSIAEMVDGLAARLAQDPQNLEGWVMLGRSYRVLERYEDALGAFARARELAPQDPDVLVFYGETLGLTRGGDLTGEPERLVTAALAQRPDHVNALWLKGLAAEQRGDNAAAVTHWERLRGLIPDDQRATLDSYLAEVRARLGDGEGPVPTAATTPAEPEPTATNAEITVKVRLNPALAPAARPGDTVFVFARAASGPRMPLAIVRKTVADLPLEVVLSDEMAMAPNFRLSNFDQVVVGARVSRSGNAMPQAGDLEGTSTPLAWRDAPSVEVVIDSRVDG